MTDQGSETIKPKETEVKPSTKTHTRREVLKKGGQILVGALAGGAIGSVPPTRQGERKISEKFWLNVLKGKIKTNINSPTNPATPTPEKRELMSFQPKVTIVDAAPSFPTKGVIQDEFPQNDKLIQELLGDKYISVEQLKKEFGEDYDNHWMVVTEKYPEAGVMYKFFDTYFHHGENVAKVMEKVWENEGLKSQGIRIKPLQRIIDKTSKAPAKDDLQNEGTAISFDSGRIIKLLEGDPNPVVNFSFQVGDVGLFLKKRDKTVPAVEIPIIEYETDSEGNPTNKDTLYLHPTGLRTYIHSYSKGSYGVPLIDGKEIPSVSKDEYNARIRQKNEEAEKNAKIDEVNSLVPSIVGAYDKSKAERNLPKLFEVCNAYPEKLFVVAGGNKKEDMRKALEQLKDRKPKNLIIVAQWANWVENQAPYHGVQGADIYVDNEQLNVPEGSSFSTPVISAHAEMLFRQGLTMDEVVQKIRSSCTEVDYSLQGLIDENKALVFDKQSIAKLKNQLPKPSDNNK